MARGGNVRISITADDRGLQRGVRSAEGHLTRLNKTGTSALGGVTKASEKAAGAIGGKAGLLGSVAGLGKSFAGSTPGMIAGAAALGAVAKAADEAVSKTVDLGTATLKLQPLWKENAANTSAFAEVLSVRGVSVTKFQMALIKMAKAQTEVSRGSKVAKENFAAFGISAEQAGKLTPHEIINKIADAFHKSGISAKEATGAQAILGRSFKDLLPILKGGHGALDQQLAMVKKYGAYLTGNGVHSVRQFVAAQRESKYATDGLKIAFGTQLVPILMKGIQVFTQLVRGIQSGKGKFGELKAVLQAVGQGFTLLWSIGKQAIGGLVQTISGIVKAVKGVVKFVTSIVHGDWTGAWRGAKQVVSGLFSGIVGSFRSWFAPVLGVVDRVTGGIGKAFSSVAGSIKGAFQDAVNTVIDGLNAIVDAVNSIPSLDTPFGKIGLPHLGRIGHWGASTPRGGAINHRGLAGGGRVPGGSVAADTVPAMLSPQEFVVTGGGESILEQMTFPGVLDWLQGVQPRHFAGGGRASDHRGRASWYGGPHDSMDSGRTAFGFTTAHPGISLNEALHNSSLGRQFYRVVSPNHRSAVLPVIDKGPADWTHRGIDITYSALGMFGYSEGNFPTDSIFRWTGPYPDRASARGGTSARSSRSGTRGTPGHWNPAKVGNPSLSRVIGPRIGASWLEGAAYGAEHGHTRIPGDALSGILGAGWSTDDFPTWVPGTPGTPGGPRSRPGRARPGRGHASGAAGLGTFEGRRVAKWIIPELQYARSHGWHGPVTSGYRSPAHNRAVGGAPGSEHTKAGPYPHGAVDFGGGYGYRDPVALANRSAFFRATRGFRGLRLKPATGFQDDGHASGTGHRYGGRVGFAAGGRAGRARAVAPRDKLRGSFAAPGGYAPGAIMAAMTRDFLSLAKLTGRSDQGRVNSTVSHIKNLAGRLRYHELAALDKQIRWTKTQLTGPDPSGEKKRGRVNLQKALSAIQFYEGMSLTAPIAQSSGVLGDIGEQLSDLPNNAAILHLSEGQTTGIQRGLEQRGVDYWRQHGRPNLEQAERRALARGDKTTAGTIRTAINDNERTVRGWMADLATPASSGDQTIQDNTEALNTMNDLLKQQLTNTQQMLNVSQSQYGVLAQAITSVVSGQIGGKVGLGMASPSFAGGVARY